MRHTTAAIVARWQATVPARWHLRRRRGGGGCFLLRGRTISPLRRLQTCHPKEPPEPPEHAVRLVAQPERLTRARALALGQWDHHLGTPALAASVPCKAQLARQVWPFHLPEKDKGKRDGLSRAMLRVTASAEPARCRGKRTLAATRQRLSYPGSLTACRSQVGARWPTVWPLRVECTWHILALFVILPPSLHGSLQHRGGQ